MKRIFLIMVLILLHVSAQEQAVEKEIDIKEIVEKQIEAAKVKMSQGEINQAAITIKHSEKSEIEKVLAFLQNNSIETKVVILFFFSTIVFSFVAVRRINKKNRTQTNDLKKNVQLMREQKFIKPIDPKLKKLRTNLFLTSRYLEDNSSLSNTARKYNIAKTELILASRFRKETLRAN